MRFTLLVIIAILLLTGCNQNDDELRRKIAGTWTANSNGTFTIASDGGFVSQWAVVRKNVPSGLIYRGTWQIKDGILISIITNVDGLEPHLPVGKIEYAKIIQMEKNEMTYLINGQKIKAQRK